MARLLSSPSPSTAISSQIPDSAQGALLPRSASDENPLAFGGALLKVEDYAPVKRDASFWRLIRDIKLADPKIYESAPLAPDYKKLLKNPRHYRLLAQPLKVRGIIIDWFAIKTDQNDAGIHDYYESYLFDGEDAYVLNSWEKPPIEKEDLRRTPVEAQGIFYQIFPYETSSATLRTTFRKAVLYLKRGQFLYALEDLQALLEQDPNPAMIAKEVQSVPADLWEPFKAKGEEYVDVVRRVDALATKGLDMPASETMIEQPLKVNAPMFLTKSIQRLQPKAEYSALDQFMGSWAGTLTLFVGIFLMVGVFFLLFLKMQRRVEEKGKRDREEFWREARRNIKGVSPPGNPRFSGEPSDPMDPSGPKF